MPNLIGPDLWSPNSPGLNLVDYKVWGVVQQRVYECCMNSVDELKLSLVEVWNSLQQNVIDAAFNGSGGDKNSSGDEIANVNFYAVRPKRPEFAEITQNNGHYAVQGHSRSPILVPIASSYTISY